MKTPYFKTQTEPRKQNIRINSIKKMLSSFYKNRVLSRPCEKSCRKVKFPKEKLQNIIIKLNFPHKNSKKSLKS
jgi:hypothetical protein